MLLTRRICKRPDQQKNEQTLGPLVFIQIRYGVFSLSIVLFMRFMLRLVLSNIFLCETPSWHFGSFFSETRDVARVIRVTSEYRVQNLI